jgi:hypothetical protein
LDRRVIAAVVVALVVVGAVLFYSSEGSRTYPVEISNGSSSVTNLPTGLRLSLEIDPANSKGGGAIEALVNETNTLRSSNDVTGANDVLFGSLSPFPTGLYLTPMYLAVYRGNYVVSNLSSASPLAIMVQPTYTGMPARVEYFLFQPSSDQATAFVSQQVSNGTWPLPSPSWSGPVSGRATFQGFSPGKYTVAAGDEWGEILLLYFVVK